MKTLGQVSSAEAKSYFLKNKSYFNGDLPTYIDFAPLLKNIDKILHGVNYDTFLKKKKPGDFPDVNYNFIANKDGRFAWRPLELIHPVLYVSLLNSICTKDHWTQITSFLKPIESEAVTCCSLPVISTGVQSEKATQISNWWESVEQQSLKLSLEFSYLIYTDVADCYGSLYTHSIPWAIHGQNESKRSKGDNTLIGNIIDRHISAGRYGQTNGIPQGSTLMDLIAEIVLRYVDRNITTVIGNKSDFAILRYRDDYMIFTNNSHRAEAILKVISDSLRHVGMKLNTSKTVISNNVIQGSIKPDKLAGMEFASFRNSKLHILQEQLLRLHSFGRHHPNSGSLRRFLSEFYQNILRKKIESHNLRLLRKS